MRTRIVILGLCIAAGAGGAVAWHNGHADAAIEPTAAPAPVPVVAEKVRVSDMPTVLTGIGTVVAYNVVQVHAQVTGTIDKIGFTEGQTVHPGSLIAQLDPRPFQASLQQAQAALARDKANLAAAQADLGRYSTLLKQGFATQQQVTDQTATVSELQAAIAGDKATIFNAQTQLGYTTITSPIDGVTGIQEVDIGNIVQPSSTTPIVTITQIQPISVIFTLPQDDVPAVQQAMAKGKLRVNRLRPERPHEAGRGYAAAGEQHGQPKLGRHPAQGHLSQRQPNPVARRVRQCAADPRASSTTRSRCRWTRCNRGRTARRSMSSPRTARCSCAR